MLGIYLFTGGSGLVSSGGDMTNPMLFETDNLGEIFERKYFLRMSSPSAEYASDGTVYVLDSDGTDESSWIEIAPDSSGVPGTYDSYLEFDLALDEELPFWIRVTVPAGASGLPKTDLSIGVEYTRHII